MSITTNVMSLNPTQRGALYTTFCDKVYQWFSQDTQVSSTNNKTDCHDRTEIFLKVAWTTITLTKPQEMTSNNKEFSQHYLPIIGDNFTVPIIYIQYSKLLMGMINIYN